MVAIRPYTTTSPIRLIAFYVRCRWSGRSRRRRSGRASSPWRRSASCPGVHFPHADRLSLTGGDVHDRRQRLEVVGAVLGERSAPLRLLVPDDHHHRLAALAIDQV